MASPLPRRDIRSVIAAWSITPTRGVLQLGSGVETIENRRWPVYATGLEIGEYWRPTRYSLLAIHSLQSTTATHALLPEGATHAPQPAIDLRVPDLGPARGTRAQVSKFGAIGINVPRYLPHQEYWLAMVGLHGADGRATWCAACSSGAVQALPEKTKAAPAAISESRWHGSSPAARAGRSPESANTISVIDLLHGLELGRRIDGVAIAVGRHRRQILDEGDAPGRENDQRRGAAP